VELSCAPYYHPIMPLVCDLRAASVALPQMVIPAVSFRHPDDARWHLRQGLARHEQAFGRRPQGLWPSEGSVSPEAIGLVIEQGLRWTATDEEILWRTLRRGRDPETLYRPHRLRHGDGQVHIVFRDRELSDLIGFVYSQWNPMAAVQDFLKRLGGIHQRMQHSSRPALVTVILDGENAWEYYPDDAHEFFTALYGALAADTRFKAVTVSEYLDQYPLDPSDALPEIFSGSWIDGNFATWIGHPEKNTAWSHLARVREDLDTVQQSGTAPADALVRAWRSFYAAEGSDWMWWLGDTHSSAQDAEFDRLFRTHLINVYHALDQPPPPWLDVPIISVSVQVTRVPVALTTPTIDGRETSYYEWLYAGYLDLRKGYGAAHRGAQALLGLHYALDQEAYYFRVDIDHERVRALGEWQLTIELRDRGAKLVIQREAEGALSARLVQPTIEPLTCAFDRVIELAVPIRLVGAPTSQALSVRVLLAQGRHTVEQYPSQGTFRLEMPSEELDGSMWSV
jgi:alpha-amylase/alpha-mannosidase (GH57 family)